MRPDQSCKNYHSFNKKQRATTEHILDRILRKNTGDNGTERGEKRCDKALSEHDFRNLVILS